MSWFTAATSYASIVNGVALALGFYWPAVTTGAGRAILITSIITAFAAINVRGIRQGAWLINALTIAKLLPLGIFVLVGLFFVRLDRLTMPSPITLSQAGNAALLLLFAFGGYHVIAVPAGEANNPRQHLPFALVFTIVGVTAIMTLTQVVAMGTLPHMADSRTPLADGVARLVMYAGTCAATIRLRQPRFAESVPSPTFVIPFGPAVPAFALIVSFAMLSGVSRDQLLVGLLALAVGALLFSLNSEDLDRRIPGSARRSS